MAEKQQRGSEPEHIPPPRVAEIAAAGKAQLIDVRSEHEWEAGHLAGALRIYLPDLSGRAGEVDRRRTVIFYCRGGNRSAMAAEAFRAEGYDAHNMEGGVAAWEQAGLPLEPEGGYVAESGEAAAELEARRLAREGA